MTKLDYEPKPPAKRWQRIALRVAIYGALFGTFGYFAFLALIRAVVIK